MKKFVAYYRVSTTRQGQSGLGLDAQEEAVRRLVEFKGGVIIASYREVESGAKNNRPELATAMKLAKKERATVIVAKLDRLARDAKFLLHLADSEVPLLFGDFPDMDCTTPVGRMVLTQMASVAEFERRRISERVKAALQQAQLRGVKLGGYRGGYFIPGASAAGRATKIAQAEKRTIELYETILEIDEYGTMSRAQIAEQLNVRHIATPSGKGSWRVTTVTRVLKRVEEMNERNHAAARKSLRSIHNRLQKQPRSVCKRVSGGGA